MKYIVCGISFAAGTKEDDSPQLRQYFELGWEVVGSRVDAISKKNSGILDVKDTTIVTTKDRMFMYEKIFPNVMSCEQFLELGKSNPEVRYRSASVDPSLVEDWPSYRSNTSDKSAASFSFLKQETHCLESGQYVWHERDFQDIFEGYSVDPQYSEENFSRPCIVMGYRSRSHLSHKNSKDDELRIATALAREGGVDNADIFVVGNGKEVIEFCSENGFTHVPQLKSFVSILKNSNCICHVAPSTGTTLVSFHAAKCPIILVDPHEAAKLDSLNAITGGKPSHFFQSGLTWLKGRRQVNNFIRNIDVESKKIIGSSAQGSVVSEYRSN